MASATEMDSKISFWTLCPYCYIYYEYPKRYEECTLQCQNCQRGFHAVVIRSPPLNEIDSSLCTWGFFPLGFSGDSKDVNGASSNWNPIAPLFPSSMKGSSSRTDSGNAGEKEAVERLGGSATGAAPGNGNEKNVGAVDAAGVKGSSNRTDSGKAGEKEAVERPGGSATGAAAGNGNEKNVGAVDAAGVKADTSKKAVQSSSMRRGAGNLDLNVEFSNDVEEPSCVVRACEEDATSDAEDDIEWNDFLKGLDHMIRNLPFLNVEGDDKVKGH